MADIEELKAVGVSDRFILTVKHDLLIMRILNEINE